MSKCARCQMPLRPTEASVLANTTIAVCRSCEQAWLHAVESKRLRAISASLFAEFVERERCELLSEQRAAEEQRALEEQRTREGLNGAAD